MGERVEEVSYYPLEWLAEMDRSRRVGEGSEEEGRIAWLDDSNPSSASPSSITSSTHPPIDPFAASSSNSQPFRSIASVSASELKLEPSRTSLGADPLVIRGAATGINRQHTAKGSKDHHKNIIISPEELGEVVDSLGGELDFEARIRRATPLSRDEAPGGLDFSMDLW